MKYPILLIVFVFLALSLFSQSSDSTTVYKKRVLETAEVEFLSGFYLQDGNNAAVSGGIGTEKLTDIHPTVVISIPLNADDVLTVEGGISAYTSASSSNVDPFDGNGKADAFQASSGASSSDTWYSGSGTYSHSSDDRNNVFTATASFASEYDYTSIGFGGSYTRLFNKKNTELSIKANAFIDRWSALYPKELRPFANGSGINDNFFSRNTITGNANYNPNFSEFTSESRNSYALGLGFSQILTRNMQASVAIDVVQQTGLLSTPFQRVYFSDVANSYIDDFHLADDIERLPDNRLKIAIGGRLHYYINEKIVLRSYYRYYEDDWGIQSHTASLEVPIKLTDKFTLAPSYRYYTQTAADYFAPYDQHLSASEFYTSDYDLSGFKANQYGLGITYTDILTKINFFKWGMKSASLRLNYYERDSGLQAYNIGIGLKFVRN